MNSRLTNRRQWWPLLKISSSKRLNRLREGNRLILQAALAAALAWAFATHVLGHTRPFFAPLAALILIGLSQSGRFMRTAELVVGVALGILVADLVISVIGIGDWQVFLVVALAMSLAVLLGSGRTLMAQAGVSAMLVATIQPPSSGLGLERFVDALVGGSVALLVVMLLPAHPVKAVDRAAQRLLGELSHVLNELAAALRTQDMAAAVRALHHARSLDRDEQLWLEAVDVGYETARTAPAYRGKLGEIDDYAVAAEQMDFAHRNIRVLARAVIRAVELDAKVPDAVLKALEELALAVRCLGEELSDHEGGSQAREHALEAVALTTDALDDNTALPVSVIVAQIRSSAVDLLRGLGEEGPAARTAVRSAAATGETHPPSAQ